MTRFWKDGYWRASPNGGDHWVTGHWVERDDWGGGGGSDYQNDDYFHNTMHELNSRPFEDFVKTTTCPICGAEVYFIRHNGGCVWLDSLGKPWPKHPCFDDSDEVYFSSTIKEMVSNKVDAFAIVTDVQKNHRQQKHKLTIKCNNGKIIEGLFKYPENVDEWLGQLVIVTQEHGTIILANTFLNKIYGHSVNEKNISEKPKGSLGEALRKALNNKI